MVYVWCKVRAFVARTGALASASWGASNPYVITLNNIFRRKVAQLFIFLIFLEGTVDLRVFRKKHLDKHGVCAVLKAKGCGG